MAPPKPKPKAKPKPAKQQISAPGKGKEPKSSEREQASSLPLELQQLLLNIFKNAFSERLESDIKPLLQEVKGHLYNRDFLTAFGKNEYLEAYAARWSPSRALGYLQVYDALGEYIVPQSKDRGDNFDKSWQVVCLGGGAGAEIVALAGLQKLLLVSADTDQERKKLEIVAIDIANWSHIVETLSHNITTAPPLSKYASAAVKAASIPLVDPEHLSFTFHQQDVLNSTPAALNTLLGSARLVTLMFTLNELYSTSLSMTQKFLLNLTAALAPGSYFLVVDSPGSYSTVTLNGAEKKYPMKWLLDHTLLKSGDGGKVGDNDGASWEKVKEEESTWFRLHEALTYPIGLENMRFQLHLYRRI